MSQSQEVPRIRRRIIVRGLVQGIGYRPFVYGLARYHGLSGNVFNDSLGVCIEVQGEPEAVDAFQHNLLQQSPPLAVINAVTFENLPPRDDREFTIIPSRAEVGQSTPVSPDLATCGACLKELFDPSDRRYRYPFINCTQCGPRFTIVRDLPYDRPRTTMADFRMCPECALEYHDPANRRFHAQPNACPVCGPKVWFVPSVDAARAADRPLDPGAFPRGEEALALARRAIENGQIVAVKGLGGFHLACDATQDAAVSLLRARKGRMDKPFALMAASVKAVRDHVEVSAEEERLLAGRERPIVLLRRRAETSGSAWPLSAQVAPGNERLGFMIAYTPIHHLLMSDRPLVMTSGNLGDEPIARDNADAFARLVPLADGFLVHDRPIEAVCDDSVVCVFQGREAPIRRSRGYAPMPVPWPGAGPPVLAVGGELKAVFCLTRPPYAYVSQHIGDMGNLETLGAFERAVEHLRTLFRVEPGVVACDLHPGYLSTGWAERWASRAGVALERVQHHHAHAASVMVENGLDGSQPVIAVIFDGTGYGTDGAIWGGEVLAADFRGFQRLAHLKYIPLPGGDAAIKRPFRVALAHLRSAGITWDDDLPCVAACPDVERRVLWRQLERALNCVPTSSMGRLFDAVAALLGVRQTVTYEAQAAIEMEASCHGWDASADMAFDLDRPSADGPIQIDPAPVLHALREALCRGEPPAHLAGRFHRAVADLIVTLSRLAREHTDLSTVALSGGVFQNVLLQRLAVESLRREGLEVLIHRLVPPNDGGLALGQAAVASARHRTNS